MTKPLALLVYEALLPGSQLVNRLRDLGYRVQSLSNPAQLVAHAEREKPLVAIVDLASQQHDVSALIRALRGHRETAHIPVIAYTDPKHREQQAAARAAGATLVAAREGILEQLPELLEQALEVE